MNEIFSARRLGLLLRNDLIGRYRAFLMVSAVFAALMLVGSMLNNALGQPPMGGGNSYFYAFPALLFMWGTAVASRAFTELHAKTQNEAYLLLPASDVEKTVARLLTVTVGFFVYLLIYVTLVSWVVETLNLLLFDMQDRPFNPFDVNAALVIGHYLVAQSIFFLGAAWFRKSHYWKTWLALIVIGIACFAFAWLLTWLLFGQNRDGFGVSFNESELYRIYMANGPLYDAAARALKFAYFFLLPPFCWFVAWLRVKETQVSHGV